MGLITPASQDMFTGPADTLTMLHTQLPDEHVHLQAQPRPGVPVPDIRRGLRSPPRQALANATT
jgi:hypothetical protein